MGTSWSVLTRRLRSALVEKGEGILSSCSDLVLAIGHSARDTYEMLFTSSVAMEPKPFSMGVRMSICNQTSTERSTALSRTIWRCCPPTMLACHRKRSAYTFCMCPGGFVVAAASEKAAS